MKSTPLVILGIFVLSASLRAQQPSPDETNASISDSLQTMRRSLDALRTPPRTETDAFLSIFKLIEAADQLARHSHPDAARLLYKQAAAGLEELALLRPDWESKTVGFKIKTVLEKLAALPPPPADGVPIAIPRPRASASGESLPKGAKEFEFNGQKYYLIPLGN